MKTKQKVIKFTKQELAADEKKLANPNNKRCIQCGVCVGVDVDFTPARVRTLDEFGGVLCVVDSPWNKLGVNILERYILDPLQVDFKKVVISYAIRGDEKNPKVSQVDLCSAFMRLDIRFYRPRAIMCFGAEAIRSVTGMKKISIEDIFLKKLWWYESAQYDPTKYTPTAIPVLATYGFEMCLASGEKSVGWQTHRVIKQHVRKFLFPETGVKEFPTLEVFGENNS